MKPKYTLVVHGGSGMITKENMRPEAEENYIGALNRALDAGEDILESGGSAIEAVTRTIVYLEDNPLFNAGRGAVFNHNGQNELDASIMDGISQRAGSVASVTNVKNPILAARAVMEKTEHVMLIGSGAEQFSREQGLEMVDPWYFFTESRWNALQRILDTKLEMTELDHDAEEKHGTVGAVALDAHGNLAAGTSTGGMTNKRYNRVGDSPIIGAGAYADNAACAISCTGHGEFFIRYAVAFDIFAQMIYGNKTLSEAADFIIHHKLTSKGGNGGIIAVDTGGHVAMTFNTSGMYRGFTRPGERQVRIFGD